MELKKQVDVCVVGAGHAGCEAALACARSECTAGPLETFNILDWIKVLSIFLPISPPKASNSLTRCPLDEPPTFGLQGNA